MANRFLHRRLAALSGLILLSGVGLGPAVAADTDNVGSGGPLHAEVGSDVVADELGAASAEPEVGTADWRQLSAGGAHTCGIRTSGRLYCWGSDYYGQLGNGGIIGDRRSPSLVAGFATNWASVSAGANHTCARKTTGALFCWGSDYYGQVGDGGSRVDRTVPLQVAGTSTDWVSIKTGGYHTCALKASGRLYCWGRDNYGQVGDAGSNSSGRYSPVQVYPGATDWASVELGGHHTCAIKTTGRLYCWGFDGRGQLGDGGTNTNRIGPFQVAGATTDWSSVTAGGIHTCARKTTGRLFCWGYNALGQLGVAGVTVDRTTPVEVFGSATDWAAVDTGDFHTCAVKSTGRLLCWGYDGYSQVGDGGSNTDRFTPVFVVSDGVTWASIDVGSLHTCARKSTGRSYCWGAGANGRLGNGGPDTNRSTPVEVSV